MPEGGRQGALMEFNNILCLAGTGLFILLPRVRSICDVRCRDSSRRRAQKRHALPRLVFLKSKLDSYPTSNASASHENVYLTVRPAYADSIPIVPNWRRRSAPMVNNSSIYQLRRRGCFLPSFATITALPKLCASASACKSTSLPTLSHQLDIGHTRHRPERG